MFNRVLGEFELIDLLRKRISAAGADAGERVVLGSGDDAAVTRPAGVTATSVDTVVDGVHFRRSSFPPRAIGAKALAAAISDLAAMGASPGEAYVQLGVPGDLDPQELAGIADGLAASAAATGIVVAGGDVVGSPVLFLAVTVVGHAPDATSLVTRAGAQAGDAVVLSGQLGGAAAGLLLLDHPEHAEGLPGAIADSLRARQLEPEVRIDAGLALAAAGAGAMIDISDGLFADAGHLAKAGGVRLEIDLPRAAVAAGVAEVAAAAGVDSMELAGGGGEDYELLATVSPDRLAEALEAVRATGLDPAVVGRAETGEGVVLRGPTGREVSVRGWDQTRS